MPLCLENSIKQIPPSDMNEKQRLIGKQNLRCSSAPEPPRKKHSEEVLKLKRKGDQCHENIGKYTTKW